MKNISFISIIMITLLFVSFPSASEMCRPGNKPIHFFIDSTFSKNIQSELSVKLYKELELSLNEIGFCLQKINLSNIFKSNKYDELVMYVTSENDSFNMNQTLIICLMRIEDWTKGNIAIFREHPLISITYQSEDLNAFQSVLVKKIIENIRTQYVSHLRIQSNPNGILITTPSGLEGKTPLEWILPIGDLTIHNRTGGYVPFQREIHLDKPGIHTYFLELKKKQFYNSKFIIPTIVFALTSAAFYGGERYYYSKYLNLGKEDYLQRPEEFEGNYAKALTCERISLLTLACSALSITFAFIFK